MKRIFPIGTVVGIKDTNRSMMVIGYEGKADDGKKDDYVGVVFPEGISEDKTCFGFNEDDVSEVKYIGLINAETQVYFQNKDKEVKSKE